MPQFADESCAGIWKFQKELSGHGGGGLNQLKTDGGRWKGGGRGINGPGPEGDNAGGDGGVEILLLLFVGSFLFI